MELTFFFLNHHQTPMERRTMTATTGPAMAPTGTLLLDVPLSAVSPVDSLTQLVTAQVVRVLERRGKEGKGRSAQGKPSDLSPTYAILSPSSPPRGVKAL